MTQIVIVDDGQHRWGADEDLLLAGLNRLGWQTENGELYVEPETEADDTGLSAYLALCEAVPPAEGFEPDRYEAGDDGWTAEVGSLHGEFVWRPDRGGWQYSSAPE